MFGLRLSFPLLRNSPPASGPAHQGLVESALFVTAVWMLAATIWGNLRSTGPATLAILTFFAALFQRIDRAAALRRISVLAVAFAAAYWVRNHTDGLIAHRVGRFTLVSGLAVTVLLSAPSV